MVRANRAATLDVALALLTSKWHEERLLALLLMVEHYRRGTAAERHAVFDAYLEHLEYINNWDLVDSSAEHIVGPQVSVDNLSLLERLAASGHLWTRRVALRCVAGHVGVALPSVHEHSGTHGQSSRAIDQHRPAQRYGVAGAGRHVAEAVTAAQTSATALTR